MTAPRAPLGDMFHIGTHGWYGKPAPCWLLVTGGPCWLLMTGAVGGVCWVHVGEGGGWGVGGRGGWVTMLMLLVLVIHTRCLLVVVHVVVGIWCMIACVGVGMVEAAR